jgi:hypothetical protein
MEPRNTVCRGILRLQSKERSALRTCRGIEHSMQRVSPMLGIREPLPQVLADHRKEQGFPRQVTYADDFVILSRGYAVEARDWTRNMMTRLGLTLNEAETSIRAAREESFFLGYTFGPHRYKPDGHWYLGASPSKKSRQRVKQKVGDLLIRGDTGTWPEVRDRLNQI